MLLSVKNISYITFFFVTLALDLAVKTLISKQMRLGESIVVLHNFFNLTYVHNYGFAFGILSEQSSGLKMVMVIAAFGFLIWLIYWGFFKNTSTLVRIGVTLILSGGTGNIYDRLAHGFVRDFFDFYLGDYHWPAFNLADVWITIGIFLLIYWDLFVKNKNQTS